MRQMSTIREGTTDDIDPAMAVFLVSHARGRGGIPVSAEALARARSAFDHPTTFTVVVEHDGEIVGFGLAMQALDDDGAGPPIPGVCHISMIFVAPERWGEGIGRLLVDAMMDEARTRGYPRTQLWTGIDNTRALSLYEHAGFIRSGREKDIDDGARIAHLDRPL